MKIYKFVMLIILLLGFFASILAQNTSNWSIHLGFRGFKYSIEGGSNEMEYYFEI